MVISGDCVSLFITYIAFTGGIHLSDWCKHEKHHNKITGLISQHQMINTDTITVKYNSNINLEISRNLEITPPQLYYKKVETGKCLMGTSKNTEAISYDMQTGWLYKFKGVFNPQSDICHLRAVIGIYIYTSGLPDKMSGECFWRISFVGETSHGKTFYGKTKDDKNKLEEKNIFAVCFGSSFLNMVISTYLPQEINNTFPWVLCNIYFLFI